MLSGLFFFFKQKTAYEMRISDWSSDVCSSDLDVAAGQSARITAAIEPLVMVEGHGGGCIEPGMSQPGQQVVAAAGMAFHQPDFRLLQPAGLEQHRVWNGAFAGIVQLGANFQRADLAAIEPKQIGRANV